MFRNWRLNAILCLIAVVAGYAIARVATTSARTPATSQSIDDPLFQWLGATDEQRGAIEKADPTFSEEASRELTVLRRERESLAALMESSSSEDAAIEQQLERVIAAENALERRVGKFVLIARRQLTPAQSEQLMRLCADGLRKRAGDHLQPAR